MTVFIPMVNNLEIFILSSSNYFVTIPKINPSELLFPIIIFLQTVDRIIHILLIHLIGQMIKRLTLSTEAIKW